MNIIRGMARPRADTSNNAHRLAHIAPSFQPIGGRFFTVNIGFIMADTFPDLSTAGDGVAL
ncbi:hypothetical protein VI06_15585 [Aquitalea magnusonii]|nr:hypothetical protein VI06_15585 [Aquitalea magnusonii]